MSKLKPFIEEAVKIAMKDFFDNYFTKGLIALIVAVNAVAIFVKIPLEALDKFNVFATGLATLNAGKSVAHDFADAVRAKYSQPTQEQKV